MRQQDRDDRLLVSPLPDFDARPALGRFRERVEREHVVPSTSWTASLAARLSLASGTWARPAIATLGAIAIATGAAATGVADTILTIFEPRQVQTIRVDPTELRAIPNPSEYGTLTWIARPVKRAAADAAAAVAEAGFAPLLPSALPAGVPTQAQFAVVTEAKATFKFDEAKAQAAAAKVGATIPPMPAAIAATTLTMTAGPAILQLYGAAPNVPPDQAAWRGNPPVAIYQARAPVVVSNGATVDELRDYALAQPGIPPSVAAQIRAIGDPVRTLLIPIGFDVQDAKEVTVRGTRGFVVGDQTGLGGAVVWLERGFGFMAFGALTESDLLALVNSLR